MAAKQMNQQGKEKPIILLDEAPTLFIPNFQQIPSTARSNKIATVYSVQDIAQMQGMIGREDTEMIISNREPSFMAEAPTLPPLSALASYLVKWMSNTPAATKAARKIAAPTGSSVVSQLVRLLVLGRKPRC